MNEDIQVIIEGNVSGKKTQSRTVYNGGVLLPLFVQE